MIRFEEKLYLQNVFNSIEQIYKMKKTQQISSYEERLRASFNKLIIPDWYNHEYTSPNGLRKTKSHGHVPRIKRSNHHNNNNNNNNTYINDDTPDISTSSSINSPYLSNGTYRQSYNHRSPSRSWSEKPPLRRDSTTSSYDTNTSITYGRRFTTSSSSSSYAPGLQRVAQSSTWYKPRTFITTKNINSNTNGHIIEPPKPLPRYSKIDPGRTTNSSSLLTNIDNVHHPIKPRTMAQAQIPYEESFLDASSEGDMTIVQNSLIQEIIEQPIVSQPIISNSEITTTNIPRTNSSKSLTSETESYRSANLHSIDKNLLVSDSSSYASVNDRCLSPLSTASYHTARAGDTTSSSSSSSIGGYETPTPKLDDNATLSTHSSLSDLSHAETLEPSAEDLDIVALSIAEQKSINIPIVDVEMENTSSLPSFTSTSSNTDSLITIDSRPSENQNWYDGSIETCIHENVSNKNDSTNIREISNDEILREVDINAVGDEFFLFSPHNTTDNESINILNTKQHEHIENILSTTSNRIFTFDDKTSNIHNNNNFHYSLSNNPFDFDNNNITNNNNNSSIMITNLDDIIIDNNENNILHTNYRRPIQEDILYEVEHENSFSDHSQNTSSIIATNDKPSIKFDVNMDYLTSTDNPTINNIPQISINENEKQISTTINDNNNVLPIYILPPLYTTTTINEPTSLHINTNNIFQKWDSSNIQTTDLTSPLVYTPKIRHRQYSVGSYYDNKTTTVTLNPNYYLGSAPVSPLSRTSTTSSESHYHIQQHPSPTSYDNISLNALRRVNPFFESNTYSSSLTTNDYKQTIDSYTSSLNIDDKNHLNINQSPKIILKSSEKIIPISETESTTIIPPQSIPSPSSIRTTSVTFSQYEIPIIHPKSINEISKSSSSPSQSNIIKQESSFIQENPISPINSTIYNQRPILTHQNATYKSPSSIIHSTLYEQEPTRIHSKINREQIHPSSPIIFTRRKSNEKDYSQHIYQDIDSVTKNIKQIHTKNADLQFIRDAIERVFQFHDDESTSESSTYYEEVIDNNNEIKKQNSVQYPAIEAIQRFYNDKILSNINQNQIINEQITNLDDIIISNTHSSIINQQKNKNKILKLKSTEYERTSSEEIDDTLNDIEDVDYHDDKYKRQINNNHSTHTSNESSPILSSDIKLKTKNLLQDTQIIERQKASMLTNEIPSNLTHQTTRTTVPPIEIITEMVIEQDDITNDNHGQIDKNADDMIIFYDDIEIVEHLTNSCSSESESTSSSSSHHYSKPINTNIIQISQPPPPPIPARTLKPIHLLNNNQQQQQQQSSSTINKIYELDKFLLRKKIDINSVNDILNRTDNNIESSITHRHPSARHFVGKLNNDDILSITTTTTTTTSITQPKILNEHEHKRTIIPKTPFSTLPSRSASTNSKNDKHRSIIADTNALVKQIQNSLSRNSLHDTQINSKNLSSSTKDLRQFVSTTYSPSPSDDNIIDNNDNVKKRQQIHNTDEQSFKRQARLSKSFHNVSEYNSIDQYPKKDNNNNNNNNSTTKTQPSKSVENNLNQVSQNQIKQTHIPLNLTSVVTRTSSSALQNSDDNTRMLSMKWYTGQVNENSEISYNTHHVDADDLLHGYILTHSNRDIQSLLIRLESSNDSRIHAALDDIRSRVAQFDASKTREDLHVFMRYLESRLRDLNNNKNSLNNDITNLQQQQQQSDNISIKSRTNDSNKETSTLRQLGRQNLRSSNSMGNSTNGYQPIPSRRLSQSNTNQENSAIFDDMLNTVLGLPKKGVSTLPQMYPFKQEKSTPLIQTQITMNKTGQDIGKRLFESGTYKDPRLIYDVNKLIYIYIEIKGLVCFRDREK
ncbi:unnamed protein product [Rotaria sp. Silwood1]|nr:unnamed protein product [Rotaria sp. Silwood1]